MTACLPAGCTTPLDDAKAMTDAGLADRQMWMIGTNDAAAGFSQAEANGWATAMFDPPAETCEVWVEPWVTAPQPPEFIAAVNQVRAWIEQTAPLRPNTVVIDWAPYARRPGVLWFDGVHLAAVDNTNMVYVTPEAVQARSDIIRDGLTQCPGSAS
jgi:hypothetical protein